MIQRKDCPKGLTFKGRHHTSEHKEHISKIMMGSNNHQWKGNDVGYHSLHDWIRSHKPKPMFCERCHKKPPYDLANISGEYKRDTNDFEWLCRKCHMESDIRLVTFISKHKNNYKKLERDSLGRFVGKK